MNILITRTSLPSFSGIPPCEGLRKQKVKVYGGDRKETLFFKDIDTMDGLVDFMNYINEDIIVTKSLKVNGILEIEIYDDYRE